MKLTGFWAVALALAVFLPAARAFPPAPDGLIYGLVKDQYGTPLMNTADQVVLQTTNGLQVVAAIQPGLAIGVNYALDVPMDAGVTPDPYVTNALLAATPYKLYVKVGTVTTLPIEMMGSFAVLANPGLQTVQNLTLGADVNGDGIPDQWEQVFLSEIGLSIPLASVNPNKDYTGDGRTLKQEYFLGNYPFNPSDDFSVQIVSQNAGAAVLGFTSMLGRSYTAYGSPDLKNWAPLSFTIPAAGPAVMNSYYSSNIQPVQIQTIQPTNAPTEQFFRLELQ